MPFALKGSEHTKYQFPWRPGNRFELLVDGHEFFPRMREAIASARESVLLEIYLFESGAVASRFIDTLAQAATRGLVVKVLVDDFGAVKLSGADRERLRKAGVDLLFYNPIRLSQWLGNFFRDHRKLLIVDGEVVFVSGTGITDEFDDPRHPERSWRETTVRVSGPVLADWQALFEQVWNHFAPQPLELPEPASAPVEGGMVGRVAPTGSHLVQDIRRSLISRVRQASTRVWLCTAYFVPSRKLLRALKHASRNGADVRLLLPGPHTDHPAIRHAGRRFYSGLLRHGVRIFEYQPRFMHAKTLLCDDWVSIGSSNFDRWNFRWNLEANQEINDPRFAATVLRMLEADFADSVEIDRERWQRRPWRVRWRERLWGWVDQWLEAVGRAKEAVRKT
jgi:phosphatidylserine/phosphatidylglycerophosphate/cardiolipin synthase-like enzyme